jgi:hypothetical protein
MGYGLMPTPSVASQLVLDKSKVRGQMQAVCTHLETVVQNALHHMRKDELWKRMLYGATHGSTEGDKAVSPSLLVLPGQPLSWGVWSCAIIDFLFFP